ncbi:MAG: squalene/phytoene synthase family protein [Acidimicrobiia bacterium]
MTVVPFAMRRLFLLARGVTTDRDRPHLKRLAEIDDPEQFVWSVLPHAARSFAPSILLLPEPEARSAAVGYLYARMLDTYEDLSPTGEAGRVALREFVDRFESSPPGPAPVIRAPRVEDRRDEVHLLLVDRHALVDDLFATLDLSARTHIVRLVRDMAEGMIEFGTIFEEQSGVLDGDAQVLDYCHHVIGVPAMFMIETVMGQSATEHRADALEVSELIQLANITRDVEKDLLRGVAYHPLLRSHLGTDGRGDAERDVRIARRDLMRLATRRAAAFRRLLAAAHLPRLSSARAAAVMMMLFTDRHYRRCAASVGMSTWSGPDGLLAMTLAAMPAVVSAQWADRVLLRVERDLLATA